MKKLFERLIVFFVGFPLLLSLVIFFPQNNHLLLNLTITVFAVLGAVEFRNILSKKFLVISAPEAAIFGAVSPAAWILVISFGLPEAIVIAGFMLCASWLLVSRLFTKNVEKLDSYLSILTTGLAVLIYPGLFMAWVIRMAALSEASWIILTFFLLTLLNDAFAWASGMLFGKNNRGIFAASPNKSIAGFTGGLTASLLAGIAATILLPNAFTSSWMPSTLAGAILGLAVGVASILGDLGESAIKRSAGVKDSGSLVLGRGGALDSIDSVALAAPVFFILYQILFLK